MRASRSLPPDINESGKDFTATKEGGLFWLCRNPRRRSRWRVKLIMLERQRAVLANIHDFVDRVDATGSATLLKLYQGRSFDSTGYVPVCR